MDNCAAGLKVFRPGGLELTKKLIEKSGIERGGKVIDLGCGTGAAAAYLVQAGYAATGVDIDGAAVMRAKRARPEASFIEARCEDVPLTSGSFDGVLSECVLSLMEDKAAALREMARLLRPGGRLMMSGLYLRGGEGTLATRDELLAMLAQAGFEDIEFEDETRSLRQFVGQLIFDGRADVYKEQFCLAGLKEGAKPGYFSLTASAPAAVLSPIEIITREKTGLGDALTAGSLRKWQLRKLSDTIKWAMERNGFYREHFSGVSLPLDEEGLRSLPFMSAQDITGSEYGLLCRSQSEVARAVTLVSSGSEGAKKRIYFSRDDITETKTFFSHGMRDVASAGELVIVFLPGGTPAGVGALICDALTSFGMITRCPGPVSDYAAAGELLRREKPACVIGLPTQMLQLAKLCPDVRMKSVMLCADFVPQSLADAIGAAWRCRVFREYGSTEMGLAGGVDCGCCRGYHMRDADVLYEIVDPATGAPVPPGERGEVVFSTLSRRAVPLFRYRTGDIAAFAKTDCLCGSRAPMIEEVYGRISGECRVPGGTVSISALDESILALGSVLDYTAELTLKEIPELTLAVRWKGAPDEDAVREAAQSAVPDSVLVNIIYGAGFFTRGTIKRAIMVKRGED